MGGKEKPAEKRDVVGQDAEGSGELPDFLHDVIRQGLVTLGIDLGNVGLGVAENDLRGFQAELLADFGARAVP